MGAGGGVAYATQPPAHVYGVSSLYTCLFLFAQLHQHSQSAGPTSDAKDICTASSDTSAPPSGMGRAWSKYIIDSSLPSPPHQPVLPSVFLSLHFFVPYWLIQTHLYVWLLSVRSQFPSVSFSSPPNAPKGT